MVFPGRQQRQSRASQGATSGDTAGYCNRWYRVVHEGIHRESRAGHYAAIMRTTGVGLQHAETGIALEN